MRRLIVVVLVGLLVFGALSVAEEKEEEVRISLTVEQEGKGEVLDGYGNVILDSQKEDKKIELNKGLKSGEIDVEAVPAEDWKFVGWRHKGDIETKNSKVNINIKEDMTVTAVFEEKEMSGSGTDEDPFVVDTLEGLEKIGNDDYSLDAYYKMDANIDASPTQERLYNEGKGWEPIGGGDEKFTGHFDGNGYKVEGLYIDRPGQEYVGLFGTVENGVIKDLDLVNVEALANSYLGGLVGRSKNNDIENIFVSGELENTATEGKVGGLIGTNHNSSIHKCNTEVNILGLGRDKGGLIGVSTGDDQQVVASSATGIVNGRERVGGLIGSSSGSIRSIVENSKADSVVHSTGGLVGGLIGKNEKTLIKSSHASGEVTGKDDAIGGLIGKNVSADIKNSYATGDIEADRDNARRFGGLIGENYGGGITDCYAEGNIQGRQSGGGLIGKNDGGNISGAHTSGSVTVYGNNAGGLIGTNDGGEVTESYSDSKIEASRNTGGLIGENNGADIIDSHATGEVIGKEAVGGLIGDNSGELKVIEKSHATGNVTGEEDAVGGLIGENVNVNIINSHATGTVVGDDDDTRGIGGLIGKNHGGDVTDCYAEGKIEGGRQEAGGLVGWNYGGDVKRSYALGDVRIYGGSAGGLVGKMADEIIESFAKGDVTSTGDLSCIGGLVGRSEHGKDYMKIENSYATGAVSGGKTVGGLVGSDILDRNTIENSYAIGDVTSTDNEEVGGLVGENDGKIERSYYDKETTGQEDTGKGLPRTTEEMIQEDTFEGWNFTDIWVIEKGNTYPYLQWQDNYIPKPLEN